MLQNLESLIQLQEVDNHATALRAKIDAIPAHLQTLNDDVTARANEVDNTKNRFEKHKIERQNLENELSQVQTRLSRFKEQLMDVKTNKEYQAMQNEIAGGQKEVQRFEDKLLEQMLESDKLTTEVRDVEQLLEAKQNEVNQKRTVLETERGKIEKQIEALSAKRSQLTKSVSQEVMSLFEMLSQQRKGIAVVKVSEGHCTACRVRLRPQLFNDVRLNENLIQCEICQRILYYDQNSGLEQSGEQ